LVPSLYGSRESSVPLLNTVLEAEPVPSSAFVIFITDLFSGVSRSYDIERLGLVVAGVDVRERLPVGVSDDEAAGDLVDAPGLGESVWRFCHLTRSFLDRRRAATIISYA
jgi:hypothetical protein